MERIEHAGVVRHIDGRHALVAVETSGCSSCGHGSACGIGKLAAGRPATVLRLPAADGLATGDAVTVALSAHRLTAAAIVGYLVPALALLTGAGLGQATGSDAAAALGALGGFAGALLAGRALIAHVPALRPTPQLITHQESFHG